jgi:hypothetical protein
MGEEMAASDSVLCVGVHRPTETILGGSSEGVQETLCSTHCGRSVCPFGQRLQSRTSQSETLLPGWACMAPVRRPAPRWVGKGWDTSLLFLPWWKPRQLI